jgi:hypothetical protein
MRVVWTSAGWYMTRMAVLLQEHAVPVVPDGTRVRVRLRATPTWEDTLVDYHDRALVIAWAPGTEWEGLGDLLTSRGDGGMGMGHSHQRPYGFCGLLCMGPCRACGWRWLGWRCLLCPHSHRPQRPPLTVGTHTHTHTRSLSHRDQ